MHFSYMGKPSVHWKQQRETTDSRCITLSRKIKSHTIPPRVFQFICCPRSSLTSDNTSSGYTQQLQPHDKFCRVLLSKHEEKHKQEDHTTKAISWVFERREHEVSGGHDSVILLSTSRSYLSRLQTWLSWIWLFAILPQISIPVLCDLRSNKIASLNYCFDIIAM